MSSRPSFRAALRPVISDPAVLAIPIIECGEPMVDLRAAGLLCADWHPRASSRERTRFHARAGAAERLLVADRLLGPSRRLAIAEAHRSLDAQRRSWEGDLAMFRGQYPDWDEERLFAWTARFVSPPWIVPPHTTGGTVDVVVLDGAGAEVDMGWPLNAEGPLMETFAEGVLPGALGERRRLVSAMAEAGFVNYSHEWWHFSYGDRYWAYVLGRPAAIYGSVEG